MRRQRGSHLFEADELHGGDDEASATEDVGFVLLALLVLLERVGELLLARETMRARDVDDAVDVGELGTARLFLEMSEQRVDVAQLLLVVVLVELAHAHGLGEGVREHGLEREVFDAEDVEDHGVVDAELRLDGVGGGLDHAHHHVHRGHVAQKQIHVSLGVLPASSRASGHLRESAWKATTTPTRTRGSSGGRLRRT